MPCSARGLGHALEPLQLLQRLLLGLLRHAGLLDRLAQLGDLGLAVLALAKLLLNLAELLAQDVLALPPGSDSWVCSPICLDRRNTSICWAR